MSKYSYPVTQQLVFKSRSNSFITTQQEYKLLRARIVHHKSVLSDQPNTGRVGVEFLSGRSQVNLNLDTEDAFELGVALIKASASDKSAHEIMEVLSSFIPIDN